MSLDVRRRWSVASRTLAAIGGGYGLATLFTMAASLLLPLAGVGQASALLGATMAGFLVWTAVAMAVFYARSAARAWVWLVGTSALLAAITALLWPRAAA